MGDFTSGLALRARWRLLSPWTPEGWTDESWTLTGEIPRRPELFWFRMTETVRIGTLLSGPAPQGDSRYRVLRRENTRYSHGGKPHRAPGTTRTSSRITRIVLCPWRSSRASVLTSK